MERSDVLDRVAEEQSQLIERSNFEPPFNSIFTYTAAWLGQRLRDQTKEAEASGDREGEQSTTSNQS